MLTEKNFPAALKAMDFTERGTFFEKIFADNVIMRADLAAKKLFYPAQIKNRDRNSSFKDSNENLVVFECVNRLLDKGYKPQDICLEKNWQLGHTQKSGRADICVSDNDKTLFIIECKTAGAEFNRELNNMRSDGGQLFSYWQQEQSCRWLMLYTADFDSELKFSAASVSCNENIYRDAHTVKERFKIWSERCDKKFFGDVIFHDETVAYQIGTKPLRKRDLQEFKDDKFVNRFEEILRHNQVSNKETAFNRLVALFICKLVDESLTSRDSEVSFQFKDGVDSNETFQDRLQGLYAVGMEKFMRDPITYVPLNRVDELLNQVGEWRREELSSAFKKEFRKLKFFTNNEFAFIDVHNEKLFYLNAKILIEVVNILKDYKIIGATDLQTLGNMFERLLNKGFRQDAGQFFTPTPITQFIWDSLPLEEIISEEPPKIIDYACGAGHFLTEGFKAINDYFARKNLKLETMWERNKLFGVEKDPRLATVSKISLFMHGANEGKIKFGDGLENYPDENITPQTFDILVANPPYAVKGFKAHLKLTNKDFAALDKISNDGAEIETLFVERISQLVKPKGFAAVILPSSILNKDAKSFIAARESLLKNFYIRAAVQLGNKTFSATSVSTIILFLQKIFDPPEKAQLLADSAEIILSGEIIPGDIETEIFSSYLKKIGMNSAEYMNFIEEIKDDKNKIQIEREKIVYYALTFKQTTLIISTPDKIDEQEKFLGYSWSNRRGNEGIDDTNRGGFLFDKANRAAENTLAAVIRAAFKNKKIQIPALEKYYRYATLADLLDFKSADFNKTIKLVKANFKPVEYSGDFELVELGEIAPFVTERTTIDEINLSDYVTTDNMLKDKRGIKIYDDEMPKTSAATKFSKGDVLISNIRPYLKKIWLADRAGGCSPNVLVFRSHDQNILLAEYLFVALKDDAFFNFMNATAKGFKMPCGDKDKIKTYKFPLPPIKIQSKIVEEFKAIDAQITAADETIQNLDADIQKKFADMFKNYSDAKNYSFTSLCKDETASGVKFQTAEYLETGEIPIIDQSVNEIAGYMNLGNNLPPYDDLPCIIFGDHTEIFKLEREGFYLGADGTKIIIPANRNELNTIFLFHMLREEYKPLGGYARHFKNLKSLKLYLPPLELQEKFALYVENCEALKESARRRREELILEREELVRKYFR